jgi:hypothetical protein
MFFGCSPCCGGGGGGAGCALNIKNAQTLFDGVLVKLGPVTTPEYSFRFEAKFPWSVIFDGTRFLYNFRRTFDFNPPGHSIPGADVIASQGNGLSFAWRLQYLVFYYRCYSFSDGMTFSPEEISPEDRGFLQLQIIFGSDNSGYYASNYGEGVYQSGDYMRGVDANWISDTSLLSQGSMMGFDLNIDGTQTWVALRAANSLPSDVSTRQKIYQGSLGSPFSPDPKILSCELYRN